MIVTRPGRSPSARTPRTRGFVSRKFSLHVEPLEARALLSANSLLNELTAQPLSFLPLAGVTNKTPRGYTPSQISRAYGFDQISFAGGSVKGDGRGQTIAIVAAYDHPNIFSDLQVFSRTFGLPDPPSFRKINQYGGTAMPTVDSLWAQEIALDVQWAHAMAPGANILLVEANTASLPDLLEAVDTARNTPGVSVISMSWGTGEFAGMGSHDHYFTTPAGHVPITFVAAAGDAGAQAVWPAISSNVIAVGGTSLSASRGSGSYVSESAWSRGGGGYSQFVSEPGYQRSVQSSGARSSPDVSYVGNPNTGVAIYDSVGISGRSGWFQIGGTSAGAPQWAALVAIVDQGRSLAGQPLLGDGHAALYSLANTSFRDVTTGSNGNRATAGYDLVTGRGSPKANLIARELVGAAATATAGTAPAPKSAAQPPAAPVQYRYQLVYSNKRWNLVRVVANAVSADEADQAVANVIASSSSDSKIPPVAAASFTAEPVDAKIAPPQTSGYVGTAFGPTSIPRRGGGKIAPRHPADQRDGEPGSPVENDGQPDRAEPENPARREERTREAQDRDVPSDDAPGLELVEHHAEVVACLHAKMVDVCLEPVDLARLEDPLASLGAPLARQWETDLAMLAAGLAAVVCHRKRASVDHQGWHHTRRWQVLELLRD